MTQNDYLLKAKAFEHSGEFLLAFETYKSALEHWPKARGLLLGAGRSARRSNRDDLALSYFRQARGLFPDDAGIVLMVFNNELLVDIETALATATAGRIRFPDDEKIRDAEMLAKLKLGDETLIESFDLDHEIAQGTVRSKFLAEYLTIKRPHFTSSELTHLYSRVSENFPDQSFTLNYAESLLNSRRYEKALTVFNKLQTTDTSARVNAGLAICYAALGLIEESQPYLEGFWSSAPDAQFLLNSCAKFVDHAADEILAAELMTRLNLKYPDEGITHLLAFVADILPAKRRLIKTDIRDHFYTVSEANNCAALLLTFPGYGLQIGSIPFRLIDRFFAGHNIAVGAVIDRTGSLYWNGVAGLGDTRDETIANLKAALEAKGIDHVYTLGSSGGGVGAIVYGHELGANQIISFSAPSDVRKSFLAEVGDSRAKASINALNKKLTDSQMNLRGWLEQRAQRIPTHLYFCANEHFDVLQAENIKHVPGVELHPVVQYAQHDSACPALGTGQLLTAFQSIVKEVSGHATNR